MTTLHKVEHAPVSLIDLRGVELERLRRLCADAAAADVVRVSAQHNHVQRELAADLRSLQLLMQPWTYVIS